MKKLLLALIATSLVLSVAGPASAVRGVYITKDWGHIYKSQTLDVYVDNIRPEQFKVSCHAAIWFSSDRYPNGHKRAKDFSGTVKPYGQITIGAYWFLPRSAYTYRREVTCKVI